MDGLITSSAHRIRESQSRKEDPRVVFVLSMRVLGVAGPLCLLAFAGQLLWKLGLDAGSMGEVVIG